MTTTPTATHEAGGETTDQSRLSRWRSEHGEFFFQAVVAVVAIIVLEVLFFVFATPADAAFTWRQRIPYVVAIAVLALGLWPTVKALIVGGLARILVPILHVAQTVAWFFGAMFILWVGAGRGDFMLTQDELWAVRLWRGGGPVWSVLSAIALVAGAFLMFRLISAASVDLSELNRLRQAVRDNDTNAAAWSDYAVATKSTLDQWGEWIERLVRFNGRAASAVERAQAAHAASLEVAELNARQAELAALTEQRDLKEPLYNEVAKEAADNPGNARMADKRDKLKAELDQLDVDIAAKEAEVTTAQAVADASPTAKEIARREAVVDHGKQLLADARSSEDSAKKSFQDGTNGAATAKTQADTTRTQLREEQERVDELKSTNRRSVMGVILAIVLCVVIGLVLLMAPYGNAIV